MREMDPNWRGRNTSGAKAQRERAKTPLTEAERRGERTTRAEAADLALNPALVSFEETTAVLASRDSVRRSRRTTVLSRYARMHWAVQDDPYHWPCSQCYYDFTDENNVFTDLLNFGSADCWFKCSRPRPQPDSLNYEHTRWKCIRCNLEWYYDFSISGVFPDCHICGEEFSYNQDWWTIRYLPVKPREPVESTS